MRFKAGRGIGCCSMRRCCWMPPAKGLPSAAASPPLGVRLSPGRPTPNWRNWRRLREPGLRRRSAFPREEEVRTMKHLRQLEDQSVYILREAYKHFNHLAMLWSMGKDSTVRWWLARKAFFGHVPFPLLHVDTSSQLHAIID